jgi:hypothetical protein
VTASRAKALLRDATRTEDRLERHLRVAAALREVLSREPVVVGGTAEEFQSGAPYHETDLDVCGVVTEAERATLRSLGFRKRGRHWYHDGSHVAVEFPDDRIDGDEDRIEHVSVGRGEAAIIGVDDLYVDRLRQATAPISNVESSVEFHSAVAVATGAFERIDRRYVLRRIREIERREGRIGSRMRVLDSRIRRIAKRAQEPGRQARDR